MTSFSVSAAEFVPMAMREGRAPNSTANPQSNSRANASPTSQDPISIFNSQMSSTAAATSNSTGAAGGAQQQQQATSTMLHGGGGSGGGIGLGLGLGMGGGVAFSGTKSTVCTPFFRQGSCPDVNCRFAHCLSELEFSAQQQLIGMAGGEEFLPIHFTQGMYQGHMHMPRAGGLFSASAPPTPSNLIGGGMRQLGGRGVSNNAMMNNNAGSNTHSGGHNGGGGSSSGGGGGAWEDVRVTLPARCHYPHAISGTYYDYLNVKRHCAPKDIEASYRSWRGSGYKAAKAIDQSKADAMDRLVVEARLVLGNPIMRAEYDALLPLEEGAVLPPPSRLGDEESIW